MEGIEKSMNKTPKERYKPKVYSIEIKDKSINESDISGGLIIPKSEEHMENVYFDKKGHLRKSTPPEPHTEEDK